MPVSTLSDAPSLQEVALEAPRPIIGLICHGTANGSAVADAYIEAVEKAGGCPILLPIVAGKKTLLSIIKDMDALILTGGGDIWPPFLGEEPIPELGNVQPKRDAMELYIFQIAVKLQMPILGICRGVQLANAALGGTLYQDLGSQYREGSLVAHQPQMSMQHAAHRVDMQPGRLMEIFALSEEQPFLYVNSQHHQAIKEAAPGLKVVGRSADGVVEAVEGYPELPFLGVQWHPEQMVAGGNAEQLELFRFLVDEATLYRQARLFHRSCFTLDSHTDTPMTFAEGTRFALDGAACLDLPKMQLGDLSAAATVVYIPQGPLTEEDYAAAWQLYGSTMEMLKQQVAEIPRGLRLCSFRQYKKEAASGDKILFPALENGYPIGEDLSRLEKLAEDGAVYITLCHNGDNQICDAAQKSRRTHGGLSAFGRKVVQRMNDLGITIDVSHAADDTIRDVLALSTKPIIASHSASRAVTPHPRNLSDELAQAIARQGGVVQVCLYQGFISQHAEQATLADAAKHIRYLANLIGVQHVGVGSDLDGGTGFPGFRSALCYRALTQELFRHGFCSAELELIWGKNLFRVWQDNQS